jgi:HK97 gp10 family phage protein
MSSVDAVMRMVRAHVDETRGVAEKALARFADSVAADAREHAPVRKMVSTQRKTKGIVNPEAKGPGDYWLKAPGFTGSRRKQGRAPNKAEFALMEAEAAKTTWLNKKTGLVEKGYINPNVRIATNRRVQKTSSAMDRRNAGSSKYRQLGTVRKTKNQQGGYDYTFRARKGVRANMVITPSLQNKPGVVELPTISVAKDKSGNNIPMVGKGVLRHMNARQRYDVLHNRGITIRRTSGGAMHVVVGGALRESIEAEYDGLICHVYATVPYAKYVEFGTRYMDAQPFLWPAMMNARRRMASSIASEIKG